MSRAGVLLAGVLAMASLGVLAQTPRTAATPAPAANAQSTTSTPAQASQPANAQNQVNAAVPNSIRTSSVDDPQTDASQPASNDVGENRQLPQTSTILPLLGLIGLGSLVAGLFARR